MTTRDDLHKIASDRNDYLLNKDMSNIIETARNKAFDGKFSCKIHEFYGTVQYHNSLIDRLKEEHGVSVIEQEYNHETQHSTFVISWA